MRKHALIMLAITFTACGGPEPRRPVEVKSGSFFKESVERNQQLLAKEQAMIAEIIENDTANEYLASASGFWYRFDTDIDSLAYRPHTDDRVRLTYTMLTFDNDTLYSKSEIGEVALLVDKEQLFPGMRNAIKLLAEGERATFWFPSSLGYGYHGDGKKIPPLTPLKASVEILNIEKQIDSSNTNY